MGQDPASSWFRTFAMHVSQIDNGEGESVEMKIDLARGPPTDGG